MVKIVKLQLTVGTAATLSPFQPFLLFHNLSGRLWRTGINLNVPYPNAGDCNLLHNSLSL